MRKGEVEGGADLSLGGAYQGSEPSSPRNAWRATGGSWDVIGTVPAPPWPPPAAPLQHPTTPLVPACLPVCWFASLALTHPLILIYWQMFLLIRWHFANFFFWLIYCTLFFSFILQVNGICGTHYVFCINLYSVGYKSVLFNLQRLASDLLYEVIVTHVIILLHSELIYNGGLQKITFFLSANAKKSSNKWIKNTHINQTNLEWSIRRNKEITEQNALKLIRKTKQNINHCSLLLPQHLPYLVLDTGKQNKHALQRCELQHHHTHYQCPPIFSPNEQPSPLLQYTASQNQSAICILYTC